MVNTLTGGKSLEVGEDPGDQSFVETNVGGCPGTMAGDVRDCGTEQTNMTFYSAFLDQLLCPVGKGHGGLVTVALGEYVEKIKSVVSSNVTGSKKLCYPDLLLDHTIPLVELEV